MQLGESTIGIQSQGTGYQRQLVTTILSGLSNEKPFLKQLLIITSMYAFI